MNRIMAYRDGQVKRLEGNADLTIGDVTTVNVTMIHGGVQANVIPVEYKMMVDNRLALDIDHVEFEAMLKKWCDESGEDITFSFEQKQPKVPPTKIDSSNAYWVAFKEAIDEL
jgi:aminoacylase